MRTVIWATILYKYNEISAGQLKNVDREYNTPSEPAFFL